MIVVRMKVEKNDDYYILEEVKKYSDQESSLREIALMPVAEIDPAPFTNDTRNLAKYKLLKEYLELPKP